MVRTLPYTASPRASEVIAGFGRTEDLRFSPSNQRLAVALFRSGQIAVFDILVAASGAISLTGGVLLTSPALRQPHGLDFINDDTLVVANRTGEVVVVVLPPGQPEIPTVTVEARPICSSWEGPFEAPGSVRVSPTPASLLEVMVADNDSHTVSRLSGSRNEGRLQVGGVEVVVSGWLDIPDGLAVSPDGQWLAVSNHNPHNVLLYSRSAGAEAAPEGILRDVFYPHGLRFTPDGGMILVADAGAPYVHIYAQGREGWVGVHNPKSCRVMDDETFARGHSNPQEGGPKGLDLDRTGSILALSSEHQPLAFFSLTEVLAQAGDPPAGTVLERELSLLDKPRRLVAQLQTERSIVSEMKNSWSWRLTEPLRRLRSALEGGKRSP